MPAASLPHLPRTPPQGSPLPPSVLTSASQLSAPRHHFKLHLLLNLLLCNLFAFPLPPPFCTFPSTAHSGLFLPPLFARQIPVVTRTMSNGQDRRQLHLWK